MSDEFESNPESNYSPFWPLLILLIGVFVWSGYQVYATNSQRSVYAKEFDNAKPTIVQAQNISTRYVALMKDLVQTSAHDEAAQKIVQEAIKAGLIQVQQNPNGTNAPTATTPAPADAPKN